MKRKIIVNKKIVIPALLILMLVVIGEVTYAYFTAGVEGNNEAKKAVAKTGIMSLQFDGTNIISLEGALPGAYHEIKFSVENTGTLETPYAIDFTEVTNTFVDKNDLVYQISSSNNGGKVEKWTILPSENKTIIPVAVISKGETQEYTLTIHFKETGDNQNDNQGKIFTGKVQVNNLSHSNYLAANVLSRNSISANTPEYKSVYDASKTSIYAMDDDLGTSYYFRGNVEKNYIDLGLTYKEPIELYTHKIFRTNIQADSLFETYADAELFCLLNYFDYNYDTEDDCKKDIVSYIKQAEDPLLFRITRINGDGSVRLIADDIVGVSQFNNLDYRLAKNVGYTYDNSEANIPDGTNSTIKTYLESWYNSYLSSLDNLIVNSVYCNDTSIISSLNHTNFTINAHGSYNRLKNSNPSLICPETTLNYGGKYIEKIGLLTVDEVLLAGVSDEKFSYYTHYLVENAMWFTQSAYSSSVANGDSDYSGAQLIYKVDYSGQINSANADYYAGVKPVFSLKNDVKVVSGDGTKSNPYKIF